MTKTESGCVDCGLQCLGVGCPHYEVEIRCCDKCESEETLYKFEGEELCIECIKERLEVVI
jgi:hypothetical protein